MAKRSGRYTTDKSSNGITVTYNNEAWRRKFNAEGKYWTKALKEKLRQDLTVEKAAKYYANGGRNKGWRNRYFNAYVEFGRGGRGSDYNYQLSNKLDMIYSGIENAVPKLKHYIVDAFCALNRDNVPSIIEDIKNVDFDVMLDIHLTGFGENYGIRGSMHGRAGDEQYYNDSKFAFRKSLFDKKEGRTKVYTGPGVDNIIRAFNVGWHARYYAYGVWEGTNAYEAGGWSRTSSRNSKGERIRSRKDFEGLHFVQAAISAYNAQRRKGEPFIELPPDSIYNK